MTPNQRLPTKLILKELSFAYEHWIIFSDVEIPKTSTMNKNEIFGLRTLLDYAMHNKIKYCALDTSMVMGMPCFEITFDGLGITDSILKLNHYDENGGGNELYDLKIAFRLLEKEGYNVMLSSQLLQGSRFLIISKEADIAPFKLPGKVNTIIEG